jgi:hypothetical protein
MVGFVYHLRRYFSITKEEWLGILITALFAAFALSFRNWGGETFDVLLGLKNYLVEIVAFFLLFLLHVAAQKAVGVYYGIKVVYDKYLLGLMIGLFVTFLSFGYWPLFVTGTLAFTAIPNLRVGKFRATLPKKWEIALIAAAGPLASMLVMVPLNALHIATGVAFFHHLIGVCALIAIYAMLPIPVLPTANPYAVYMSRIEVLEGNLPGFDVFYSSPGIYCLLVGFLIVFSAVAWFFSPNTWALLIAIILG